MPTQSPRIPPTCDLWYESVTDICFIESALQIENEEHPGGQALRGVEPRGEELQRVREGHRVGHVLLSATHRHGAREGAQDDRAGLLVKHP